MSEASGRDGIGEPEQGRGGPDVERAVASAQAGSEAAPHPAPKEPVEPGESRVEGMADVVEPADEAGGDVSVGTGVEPADGPAGEPRDGEG